MPKKFTNLENLKRAILKIDKCEQICSQQKSPTENVIVCAAVLLYFPKDLNMIFSIHYKITRKNYVSTFSLCHYHHHHYQQEFRTKFTAQKMKKSSVENFIFLCSDWLITEDQCCHHKEINYFICIAN